MKKKVYHYRIATVVTKDLVSFEQFRYVSNRGWRLPITYQLNADMCIDFTDLYSNFFQVFSSSAVKKCVFFC